MDPSATPPPAPSSPIPGTATPPRRRGLRALLAGVGVLVLLAGAVGGGAAWFWHSTSGPALTVALLDRLLPARLQASGARGSFADGFGFDNFVYETPTLVVRIDGFGATLSDLDLGLSLSALRLHFSELRAERLQVRVRPSDQPSSGPPQSIASPVRISTERLAVGAFEYVSGPDAQPSTLAARAIEAQVAIGPDGYRIDGGRFAFGPAQSPLQATLDGTLAGGTPFALDARGALTGSVPASEGALPLRAALRAEGSLVDLQLRVDVQPQTAAPAGATAPAPRGQLSARLASFEAPTLRALVADLQDIDPAAWVAGAPTARLTLHAELAPLPARPGEPFTVAGPVQVSNALPGPVDTERVPVRSAQMQVQVSAQALALREADVTLTRGRARGGFDIRFDRLEAWQAQAQFNGVDPSAIHSRLRPFALDGQAQLAHEAGDTAVTGTVRNRAGVPLEATVDLRASPQRVQIDVAQLRLGRGQAMVVGEVQLTGSRATRLAGSVVEFVPALLVAGIDANLTGTFNINGVLAPQPSGTAALALADSQAFGRPLVGRGVITLDAEQRLDVDASLGVRTATLVARGGLGAPDRALTLELSAPQLRELGLPLAGRLTARARLTGAWRAPALEATAQAGGLRLGEHAIEQLEAVASYAGGTDGALSLQATASNHRFRRNPTLSLQTLTLGVDGTLADHRIELRANNEEAQPISATVVGGWFAAPSAQRAQPAQAATRRAPQPSPARAAAPAEWRGALTQASAGKPLDLRLLQPAPIRTNLSDLRIGPFDLDLAGARVERVQVDWIAGTLATAGQFRDLRPSTLRGDTGLRVPAAAGAGNGARALPIALRGQWQLRLGTQADGSVLVERSEGDIVAGTVPMGISELRLEAQLRASRLQAAVRLAGTRAGRLEAQAAAEVEGQGVNWRVAQQRPLKASLEADLPSIAWINTLLSDAVRANVRLGGSARASVRIDGTPAAPNAQGTIEGSGLRVAWIEQAVRLENGKLAARIDGDAIILDELRFVGPPQVRPGDKRPLEALAKEGAADEGFLAMNGRLSLRDAAGVLQVQAVRVPFLQRADRWVLATGGANIVFDERRVQLNGAVLANAGFIDFTRTNLPSLSADVQVRRAAEPAGAREAPIGLNFDLGIDLGPGFYLRGAGLDTRIEGQLRLRAEGRGAIRASGAVEAKDGVYEGFGQKLAIERGRVNFQGPIENPGLDILAVRSNLPVKVGVSITRTAQNPLIKLYADEAMADFQILSWLVLGRPADEVGQKPNQDRAALATAAAGLLSGSGEGLPTQLARRLGIDEISLRTGEAGAPGSLLPSSTVAGSTRATGGAGGEIVTIGKRLSENITVSFEQALTSAASLVQVSYRLSQNLSVIARAGTENALDLVYSFAFD